MIWGMAGLCAILTILFLAGKGSFLIAGYNTAGKEEKELYDEKKLCRLMGVCMGIITIGISLEAWGQAPHWLKTAGRILMFADVLVTLILANSRMVKKSTSAKGLSPGKRSRNLQRFGLGFTVLILAGVGIVLFTGSIRVQYKEEALEIRSSYWFDKEITWEEISKVTYLEELPGGMRTNGLGSFQLQAGHFQADDLGSYIRYTYVKCREGIRLDTGDEIVIVNQETPEETRILYENILKKIEG